MYYYGFVFFYTYSKPIVWIVNTLLLLLMFVKYRKNIRALSAYCRKGCEESSTSGIMSMI